MKLISQEQVTVLCNYLLASPLPSRDVQELVKMLTSLTDTEKAKEPAPGE